MTRQRFRWAVAGVCLSLTACTVSGTGMSPPAGLQVTGGAIQMVVAADPQASQAGVEILRRGGSAVDAGIAVQAVLGLIEPQHSGLLGGSVTLVWDPKTGTVESFDGMATAPAAATRALALDISGQMLDPREMAYSARAVGVPGVLPALWAAHQAHGRLPWASLFDPAIELAAAGARMPASLHALLADGAGLQGAARTPYLDPQGNLIAVGGAFQNPAYAAVLRRVARLGPDGLYAEPGLAAMVDALGMGPYPSLITEADLRGARPRVGRALCRVWTGRQICTAPAPAIGGIVMLQILGTISAGDPADVGFAHSFIEASRLAEADRRRFLADPELASVPVAGLLDPAYLIDRARLISAGSTLSRPPPGDPAETTAFTTDPQTPTSATSSVAIVDADGQALAMTSTVNLNFGARITSEGMVLNNALLNFAPPPPTALPGLGGHYANEMAPGKRPVSPIAPLIVLDAAGRPVLVGGGAGGAPIPDTMALAVIDVLAGGKSPEAALARGHLHAADPDHVVLEEATEAAALRPGLEAVGHRVALEPVETGNVLLLRGADGWTGATDPRRGGGPALGLR